VLNTGPLCGLGCLSLSLSGGGHEANERVTDSALRPLDRTIIDRPNTDRTIADRSTASCSCCDKSQASQLSVHPRFIAFALDYAQVTRISSRKKRVHGGTRT
jgi:hypothetical protein